MFLERFRKYEPGKNVPHEQKGDGKREYVLCSLLKQPRLEPEVKGEKLCFKKSGKKKEH